MKKYFSGFFVITVLLLIFSIINISDSLAQDNDNTLTIVFTHDLHDHLLSFSLDKDGQINEYGGYARIQSAINEEREKDPNLLLVDAGDFSMGTLFQTVFAQEAPGLSLLGKMGYDAVTLGNHEFDFRAQGLADCLSTARKNNTELPELLITNIYFPQDDGHMPESVANLKKAMEAYGTKEYMILERSGIRIGIFGLVGNEAISNAPMAEVQFTEPLEAAKRITETLEKEEKADLIICLSHSGTSPDKQNSEDEILAREVPGIDVIISGHSHTKLVQPIIIDDTIICSAGEYGENIGVLKIKDGANSKWQLDRYQLLQIDNKLPNDLSMVESIEKFKQKVQTDYLDEMELAFDEVLAYSPQSFLPAAEIGVRHEEEPLANLITDAYVHAVQNAEGEHYQTVDVAVVPSGTIRGSFVKGNITVADAYVVSSLGIGPDKKSGYPLISVYLTGKELKTACEVDASIAPIMSSAQLYMSGLSYTFNPNRLIFNKVTRASLQKPDGTLESIDDDKLYRVVAGLYSAQMLSVVGEKSFGILSLVPKDADGMPIVDFEEHVIRDSAVGNEIKEWQAIAQYIRSFQAIEGVPQIPLEYYQTQGRKNILDNNSFSAVFGHPNHIAAAVYSVVGLIILAVIFLGYRLLKRRKGKFTESA
ncbi:MAG: bifunctional metallophosphatase/5'-nucleotidase [Syntrophomonadaceae bacterium]|nr:bifunctional metallophosphatase/5'-nucleotidase [Syntrophomonadaceae bacterium]